MLQLFLLQTAVYSNTQRFSAGCLATSLQRRQDYLAVVQQEMIIAGKNPQIL